MKIHPLAVFVFLFLLLMTAAGECLAAETAAIDMGSRRELFVDDYLIDSSSPSAQLRLHSPTPREIAIVHDAPWEGNSCGYHTIFRDGDIYRMYYKCYQQVLEGESPPHPLYAGYAESTDGINWTKPNLGLFEFEGSTANNIIWAGPGAHDFTPFKDTNPNCAADAKYKAVAAGYPESGLIAFKSADGINWSRMGSEPIITDGAFDSQNLAFWDAERGEYRAYIRDFRDGRRDIKTSTSTDFVNWSDPVWLEYPDAPAHQLYTNQIIPYYRAPHIFLGFPTRYIERGWNDSMAALPEFEHRLLRSAVSDREGMALTDGLFMSSRDGLSFDLWSEAFIRPGLRTTDNWVYGDNYQNWGLVETKSAIPDASDEISIYATEGYWMGTGNKLRRYTIRQDGFVSMQAPYAGGEFTTKPIIFDGNRLEMNFSTSAAGTIYVEIQDTDGTPIPGFTLNDSCPIFGDDLQRTITWNGSADVGTLSGTPVRLRFTLSDADLFSFQFVSETVPSLPTKGSATFDYKYEFNGSYAASAPDKCDLDGNGIADMTLYQTNGNIPTIQNGVLRITTIGSEEIGYCTADSLSVNPDNELWRNIGFDRENGFTIEFAAKVLSQQEGKNAATGIIATPADPMNMTPNDVDGWLRIAADGQLWGNDQSLGEAGWTYDNSDAFHVFRLAYNPNNNKFQVWRDGRLLASDLGDLWVGTDGLNRFIFGDLMSADGGSVEFDYIRLTQGAYAPDEAMILLPGDANTNGTVDAADAAILAENWLKTGATWADGDFNRDGAVNDADAALLAANWLKSSSVGSASVPEPATPAMLIGLMLVGAMFSRRPGKGLVKY